MKFEVDITISLKEGMLNPEARAIQHALSNLGFITEALRTAKVYRITLETQNAEDARKKAEEMCQRLLANPVIHSHEIEVHQ
jgi:phosphoribosylformylglycinamidine synthase PurS subunit